MKEVGRLVLVLGIISVVAALALAKVYDATKEPIAEAQRQERLAAVRKVLPAIDNDPDADKVEVGGATYYVGKKSGEVAGWAFNVRSGEGYAGEIKALVGVDPTGTVTGVRILAHTETPGLGAKAAKPEFLAMFEGKSLATAKWGVKKDGGDFDQITGATVTPRALVAAVAEGLAAFETALPALAGGRTGGEGEAKP